MLTLEPARLPAGVQLSVRNDVVAVFNDSEKPVRLRARNGAVILVPAGGRKSLRSEWWLAGAQHRSFVLTQDGKDVEIVLGSRLYVDSSGCDGFYRTLGASASRVQPTSAMLGAGMALAGSASDEHGAQRLGATIALGITLAGSALVGAFLLIRSRLR